MSACQSPSTTLSPLRLIYSTPRPGPLALPTTMSAHDATAPTVAIIGASGALGSALLKELTPLAEKGAIKLVLLHRASSRLRVPPCAAGRELDVGTSDDGNVKAALEGVDVLM